MTVNPWIFWSIVLDQAKRHPWVRRVLYVVLALVGAWVLAGMILLRLGYPR